MANCVREKIYRCYDDCVPQGCPGHNAILRFQSVSNAYEYDDGKGRTLGFEQGELQTLIDLLKELNRLDAIKL